MKTATGTVTGIDTLSTGYGFGLAVVGARPVYLTGTDPVMRVALEMAQITRLPLRIAFEAGSGRLGSPDGILASVHVPGMEGENLPLAA